MENTEVLHDFDSEIEKEKNRISGIIAAEMKVNLNQVAAALALLDEGNTLPFIARYRKEATGSLDEEQLRTLSDRADYLRRLLGRKEEILRSIDEQGKLTDDLTKKIFSAKILQDVEDLYLPYKQKRRTRAQKAKERGLEPLAEIILKGESLNQSLDEAALPFVTVNEENEELSVKDTVEAWQGALDILAENISDNADIRAAIRKIIRDKSRIESELAADEETAKDFLMYGEYSEAVKAIPPHRILALNRGEKLGFLKVNVTCPEAQIIPAMEHILHIPSANRLYANTNEAGTNSGNGKNATGKNRNRSDGRNAATGSRNNTGRNKSFSSLGALGLALKEAGIEQKEEKAVKNSRTEKYVNTAKQPVIKEEKTETEPSLLKQNLAELPADRRNLAALYKEAAADSLKRLIFPSLERELRNTLTEKGETAAIHIFSANLRDLLLQQPIGGHTVIGLDPGYRTGCKTAVISPQGKVLATDTLFITGGKKQQADAEKAFVELVKKHNVTLAAIGNGTASYETEIFTADMIKKYELPLSYVIVSESGASVYSASPLARAELPELNVSLRGAVSIARRIQDPLAELVKIEPKAIGVGQYQHDVNQKELESTLDDVVESCVNQVGVELNTASPALLEHVAGISSSVAKNIISYRDEKGEFTNRKELLKVSRLGPATFTQCAGFLRIQNGENPLDNTPVHPESYKLTQNILKYLGLDKNDADAPEVRTAAAKANPEKIAAALDAGVPTVTDILAALARPGRDPREDSPAPLSRKQVTKLSDLKIGSILKGTVRNVVDFGCFVDIGLKTDGLIHRSELSNKRFKHPLDIVSTGDVLDVMIISVDEKRDRIGLSLKQLTEK